MADKKTMTPEEKALLQAKHRLEAAQARDRRKERNARTRRLILEGAELEYVVPEVREMSRQGNEPGRTPSFSQLSSSEA